jgi:hypothetical protein
MPADPCIGTQSAMRIGEPSSGRSAGSQRSALSPRRRLRDDCCRGGTLDADIARPAALASRMSPPTDEPEGGPDALSRGAAPFQGI